MIKGAQKQMIVLRTGNSRYFDEAYFVLRREVKPRRTCRDEMIKEANRILTESGMEDQKTKRSAWRGVWMFLSGSLCGGGVAALICLLLL